MQNNNGSSSSILPESGMRRSLPSSGQSGSSSQDSGNRRLPCSSRIRPGSGRFSQLLKVLRPETDSCEGRAEVLQLLLNLEQKGLLQVDTLVS
jgi:hypothetical protein